MKIMNFSPFYYYKLLIVITLLFGVLLLGYIFQDFLLLKEGEQNSIIIVSIILFVMFIYFPIKYWLNYKIIETKKSEWKVSYPYKKKILVFSKNDISKIEIIENVRMKYVLNHSSINIRLKNGENIFLNSLEMKNFNLLKDRLNVDFNELIVKSDFWKGKIG
jgi:hypothetical protein